MATRLLQPGYQELTATGSIAAGALLYTYSAGTSTPKATYSDEALTILNSNPVEADGSGRFGDIFASTGQYRLIMKTSAGATLWTADPVDGEFTFGALLTEDLAIQKADPALSLLATSGSTTLTLDKASSGQFNVVYADTAGKHRWGWSLGDNTAEAGANAGSDFALYRYADAGTFLGTPFAIFRASGIAVFETTPFDDKGSLRRLPQNAQTGAYVLVAADAGKHISITTGGVTIPIGVFSVGDQVAIYNNSTSNQTLTQGPSATVYLAGTATTGNRTLAQRGIARLLCVATNTFVIDGTGVT